jgi:hypothetical protein
MSTSTAVLTPDRLINAHDTGAARAWRALDDIVSSAEPAVVFASVVRLCAPLICDAATVAVRESDKDGYAIAWPPGGADVHVGLRHSSVVAKVGGTETDQHAAYYASLTLHFTRVAENTDQVMGQLIVERAAATIERERLTELLVRSRTNVNNLEFALSSMTSDQSFDLLRRVSQHTHRKLHDVALVVATTGAIDLPHGVTLFAQDPPTTQPTIGLRSSSELLDSNTS